MNLSSYKNIQANLFVTIDIPNYAVLNFSDYHVPYTIDGITYQALGQLVSISASHSNLRTTSEEVAIVISGIPANRITDIISAKVKGSKVKIQRAFFNPNSGALLEIAGNPMGKFQGIISNYDIADTLGMGGDTGELILTLTAVSFIDQLKGKIAGRKTNPVDQLRFYPNDHSMDRVPTVANSNFNFGAP